MSSFLLCRLPITRHSAKCMSPSANYVFYFILSWVKRPSANVCRVPDKRHSTNIALPMDLCRVRFAESCRRQSVCRELDCLCWVPVTLDQRPKSGSEGLLENRNRFASALNNDLALAPKQPFHACMCFTEQCNYEVRIIKRKKKEWKLMAMYPSHQCYHWPPFSLSRLWTTIW